MQPSLRPSKFAHAFLLLGRRRQGANPGGVASFCLNVRPWQGLDPAINQQADMRSVDGIA